MKITKDMSLGAIVEKYPATLPIIEKLFGGGCFTCPGFRMEDLNFAAAMHGMDVENIVKQLNDAVEGKA
ncbi:MAG: DUF1858 domain-containing protein [Deltaproteobacteria bacterium]|nr:DUF1858 domain-containing protein [Deltaproteobacteria bacterium]